jgi:hypothetical protein
MPNPKKKLLKLFRESVRNAVGGDSISPITPKVALGVSQNTGEWSYGL